MLLQLLERLDPRFKPHVISLKTLGDLAPRIQALGIPVEAMSTELGARGPLALIRLAVRLRSLGPDIVHTWMYRADLIGGLAARLAGVPCVIWSIRHGNLDRDKNARSTLAVVWLCAWLSRWAPTRILSNSEQARRTHIARGYMPEKMVVLPNGFDLSAFRPDASARDAVRAELGLEPGTPLVGWIGRHHPQKNVEGFFEAAAILHRRLPQVHFLLAGEGLKGVGLEGVTHALGVRNDIPRLMAALDVLASSSSGEAFSNVIGEAMACGVPCVVTDVGDSAHIVGDTGRVVPPSDVPALAAAMEDLLRMPQLERAALGARARKRIADHFEIAAIVKQYEALYDELCSRTPLLS